MRMWHPKRDIIKFLSKLGYGYAFASIEHTWRDKVFNDGPAIFSKHKILKRKMHILSQKDRRAAVQADILVGEKILHIFNTHLVHTHQKESEEQDIQATNLLKKLPNESIVLMGDFNALPESNVIRKINNVVDDADNDLLPTWGLYPKGCEICLPKGVFYKLDYIFTSHDIQVLSYLVEQSKASDHLPISAVIEI